VSFSLLKKLGEGIAAECLKRGLGHGDFEELGDIVNRGLQAALDQMAAATDGMDISCEIEAIMACRVCEAEGRRHEFFAGFTKNGFQVWCPRHVMNVVKIDFAGLALPALGGDKRPARASQEPGNA
jgi:hypothetical protein